jgi:hypothetical protein
MLALNIGIEAYKIDVLDALVDDQKHQHPSKRDLHFNKSTTRKVSADQTTN